MIKLKERTNMTPLQAYKFCPRCASTLEIKGSNILTCTQCKNRVFINASAAVGLIIENDKGQIMMAIRAQEPYKGAWDIPGGFIMPHESIEEAAIREAQEELSVTIKPGKIFANSPSIYNYQSVDVPVLDVYITATIESGRIKPSDDVAEIHFLPKDQVLKTPTWSKSIDQALNEYIKLN